MHWFFFQIDGYTWYYVMAAELAADYALSPSELPPSRTTFPASDLHAVAFQYDLLTGKVSSLEEVTNHTLTLEKCGKGDFKYLVLAPVLRNGMALLGELEKFVTVSEQRFPSLDVSGERGFAEVVGVAGESVRVTVYTGKETVLVECVIGPTGRADLTISKTPTCV